MSRYSRILSIERDNCAITDDEGKLIAFTSREEMSRITGLDFTAKFRVHYEPAILVFTDVDDADVGAEMIPYKPFEDLIDIIDILLVRQADPIYGHTPADALEIALTIKVTEIEDKRRNKSQEAEMVPDSATQYTHSHKGLERRINRQNDFNNKRAGDIDLDQTEKDEAKRYQKLTEHNTKLYDAEDKGVVDIHKLDTATEVMAFDVETDVNWPTWNPPRIGEV